MLVRFFDREDEASPFNGASLHDAAKLRELFDGLRSRKPFFCELLGENGYKLLVGLGGEIGAVQHSRIDGDPPYLMAVAASAEPTTDHTEYLIGGTATEVPARYCLPIETVVQIALHFQKTGDRSEVVAWEGI